jgi:hypothetical protein
MKNLDNLTKRRNPVNNSDLPAKARISVVSKITNRKGASTTLRSPYFPVLTTPSSDSCMAKNK